MYRLTSAREAWLDANDSTRELTWKKRYQLFQADAKRTVIMPEELQQLPWHFNFTPQAGGRESVVTVVRPGDARARRRPAAHPAAPAPLERSRA